MPGFGGENIYKHIWEEIEQAQKESEERRSKAEAKRNANEEEQRKKRAKKRRHMSRGQKEKQDKQREKKVAKRNRRQQSVEPKREEIIVVGATWFPPGTPLRIDEEWNTIDSPANAFDYILTRFCVKNTKKREKMMFFCSCGFYLICCE